MTIHPVDFGASKTLLLICHISTLVFMLVNMFFNYRDSSLDSTKKDGTKAHKPRGFIRLYSYSILTLLAAIVVYAMLFLYPFRAVFTIPSYIASICILISSLYKKRDVGLNSSEAFVLGFVFSILIRLADGLLTSEHFAMNQTLNEFLQLMIIAVRYFVFGFVISAGSVLSLKVLVERFDICASSRMPLLQKTIAHTQKMESALAEQRALIRILRLPIAAFSDFALSIVLFARYILVTTINSLIVAYSVLVRPIVRWIGGVNDKKLLRAIFFFSLIISLSVVYIFTQTIYVTDPRTENIFAFVAGVITIPYLASMIVSRNNKSKTVQE